MEQSITHGQLSTHQSLPTGNERSVCVTKEDNETGKWLTETDAMTQCLRHKFSEKVKTMASSATTLRHTSLGQANLVTALTHRCYFSEICPLSN